MRLGAFGTWFAMAICAGAAVGVSVAAAPEIAAGRLRVTFDAGTGQPCQMTYAGEAIVVPPRGALPFTFGVGPTNRVVWLHEMGLGRRLCDLRAAGEVAEVSARFGDYEVIEKYRVREDPPRVDREARLTWRGKEPLRLRGATFQSHGVRAGAMGYAWFPERWPQPRKEFGSMERGSRGSTVGTTAPLVTVLRPGLSLMWLSRTDDMPSTHVAREGDVMDVGQDVQAAGHLLPGRSQEIGVVSMLVAEGDHRTALGLVHRWLADNGVGVPQDRADWVRGATLYSFHPGGTIGSQWKDLGGFRAARERLVPSLGRLGASAAWILPVEYRSPYWPLDYYRFMDGLGDGAEYRALVEALHGAGLKVIQDIVPHGGSPEAAHNRAHPEFMLRREDGSTLGYWLNDFAREDWRDYVAGVAAHYVREYGIEGYRVDACMGSKEPNWDPAIAYSRASLAGLWGGLRMLERIRATVKGIRPSDGALLAETQSARHAPFCDLMYDFRLCYETLHGWRGMPPDEFASALAENLEDQRQVAPPGMIWLRHIESHDSLRSQLWYGVDGMHAFYALSAWIDGVPMIYQEMERGHAPALRWINDIRRDRPELARGTSNFRDVRCDAPGVFGCLRELGDRRSVVAINFNREPVRARLEWPGGSGEARLRPLGYTVLPPPPEPAPDISAVGAPEAASRRGDGVVFDDADEWFVDTVEGRLRDTFVALRPGDLSESSSIYRRPQGTGDVWRQDMQPLHPTRGRIGVLRHGRGWTMLGPRGAVAPELRLVEREGGVARLALVGLGDGDWEISAVSRPPAAPDPTEATDFGGVTLRVVGPDYIVANGHYEVVLGRQGGVVRWLRAGGKVLARDWDLYGDQEYFRHEHTSRMSASCEVEGSIRLAPEKAGLRLAFEGQIRGANRFARKRPGLWFRTEYRFDGTPGFHQGWAFRTDRSFKDKRAFLAMWVEMPDAARVRFVRDGTAMFEGVIAPSRERSGQTRGGPAPDVIEFAGPGTAVLRLRDFATPDAPCNVFMQGRRLFTSLVEGGGDSMDEGRWYEFAATWQVGP